MMLLATGDYPIDRQAGMHAMKISRFGAIGLSQARDLRCKHLQILNEFLALHLIDSPARRPA
jgi:hypothetical protein